MGTRSEFTHNGVLTHVIVDHGDGSGTLTQYAPDGTVVSSETVTGLAVFTYAPLDAAGALATLLVVEGVLPLQDAANAVAEGDAAHLVAEAEAWSLAP